MRSQVNPQHAARLRAARAEEDAALAVVSARSAAVERARDRRAHALVRYDSQVETARAELVEAIADVVRVAGLDRAAFALAMSRGALRRMLPNGKANSTAPMRPVGPPNGAD